MPKNVLTAHLLEEILPITVSSSLAQVCSLFFVCPPKHNFDIFVGTEFVPGGSHGPDAVAKPMPFSGNELGIGTSPSDQKTSGTELGIGTSPSDKKISGIGTSPSDQKISGAELGIGTSPSDQKISGTELGIGTSPSDQKIFGTELGIRTSPSDQKYLESKIKIDPERS